MNARSFAVPLVIAFVAASGSAPNDPGWDQAPQWGLRAIGLPRAWAASRGAGSVVAVVDTGVDLRHPDLRGRLVPGRDIPHDDDDAMDVNGHGTLIAGVIAADTDNGIGVASVAPLAKIMPVRVLGKDGTGSSSTVATGIRWASEHGADVINLSLAQEPEHGFLAPQSVLRTPDVDSAIEDAVAAGAVVVVAAGNDASGGKPEVAYETTSPGVVVVGASTDHDRRAAYSNYGAGLDLLAPGGGSATDPRDGACKDPNFVVSTWWDPAARASAYGGACGTSMSVAFVSGAAALLHARGLTNTQIVSRLLRTARDVGPAGRDAQSGWGRLDAARALGVPAATAPSRATPSVAGSPKPTRTAVLSPTPRLVPSARSVGAGIPASFPPDAPAPSPLPVALAAGLLALAVVAHGARISRRLPGVSSRSG